MRTGAALCSLLAIIREEAGKHFDPVLVEAFLRCQDQFDLVRERMEDCETVVGVTA